MKCPLCHPRHHFSNSPAGLTLIEMIVTLVILGILLTIAIPLMRPLIRNTSLRASANSFESALNYSRSEAVTRGNNVQICASANPMAGAPVCSGNNNWSTGWLVRNSVTGEILRVGAPLGGGIVLTGPAAAVVFGNLGSAVAGSSDDPYVVCSSGATSRVIRITASGRINHDRGALCP